MGTDRNSRIHLRFAIVSFAALAVVTAVLGYVSIQFVRTADEKTAAHSASATLGMPLQSLFATVADGAPATESVTRAADALSQPLLSSDVRALRVWASDGQTPVWAAGIAAPATLHVPQKGKLSWQRANAADGGRLFVTYAHAGAVTVEIDQAAGALDSSIAGDQGRFVQLVTGFALVVFALLQFGFRFAVGRFSADHTRLRYMYNTGDQIRSSLDLHEVVTHMSRDATSLAGGDYGLVALFDDATGDLVVHAAFDQPRDSVTHHQRSVDEWFMRRCVATNTTVTSVQPGAGYRQFFGQDAALDGPLHLLCVPVSLRDRVVGVVSVLRIATPKRGEFTPNETAQVEEIAGQAVTAVEQAQLFAKVRSHAREIEMSYDATLKALMAALDAKDEVTEGHCERVAKLTIQLAKHMGIADAQLVDIERGALLHDVGKIGVPDAVLKKPAALNDGEWEAMRKHPLLASLMVSEIGFLENAMPILLYHHERYDGGGYPFGLTGDKIPLEARIFSIIDSYDAMTSDRPYRDAMSHADAMLEIAANCGTQFDPDVAAAFESLMSARPDLRHQLGSGGAHDGDDAEPSSGRDAA